VIAELQPCPHPEWKPAEPCMCGQCPTPTGDEPDCVSCIGEPEGTRRPGAATVNGLPLCWVHWRAWNNDIGDTRNRVMDAIDTRHHQEDL
jgi:hypothetical protein